jgi:hypothetical protein
MPFTYQKNADGHYVCPTCGKTTERQNTMHYHMKRHEGKFPFECTLCKKGFLQKSTLDLHIAARHTTDAEKKFKCPAKGCEFETLTKANLQIHFLRKHCKEEVNAMSITNEGTPGITCKGCSKHCNSTTAFHYHVASCIQLPNGDDRAAAFADLRN